MTPHDDPDHVGRQLPLTASIRPDAPAPLIDEAMIRTLVDTFYEDVRDDPTLGPIFARHVADWSLHLPKMYDFWSTVVLRTGRYAGRPFESHQRLPGLTAEDFARWLDLWRHTVARVAPEAARAAFTVPAERMAANMSAALLRGGPAKSYGSQF
ncbi:MAG: group III truncated hemoglobin [Phycisphaerae bacterium]|nr:group III truncated hemoglobin [Phycisphaerae bacterium]